MGLKLDGMSGLVLTDALGPVLGATLVMRWESHHATSRLWPLQLAFCDELGSWP
jgi:hypothetical protein